jgi:hypothetical protein
MFIEMTCPCMATFQAEAEEADDMVLLWAQQFANAHQACGFMAPLNSDAPEKTKRYDINFKKRRQKEDEEYE